MSSMNIINHPRQLSKMKLSHIQLKRLCNIAAVGIVISITVGNVLPSYASGQIQTESSVNEMMCTPDYWKAQAGTDVNQVLMSYEQIETFNKKAIVSEGSNMYELTSIDEAYDATILKSQLLQAMDTDIPKKDVLYVNFTAVDCKEYIECLKAAFLATAWDGDMSPKYAVAVAQAPMRSYPVDAYVGYSQTDADDEMILSALNVNEPFVIKQICVVGNTIFYYGYSNNCCGWVNAKNLAICHDKEEWVDAWKVDVREKDFIVITEDSVRLEQSVYLPSTSQVDLKLGTILKCVPTTQIPKNIAERGTWNNYVVYLPTRTENGTYKKQITLLSQHHDVSIGFLPFTTANLYDVAFSCLGNRYGWGGMLGAMDCSLYTRNVYKCFGIEMPRNTTWQQKVEGTFTDISTLDAETKAKALSTMPAGTLLYMPGHTMIYLGTVNDISYVISALGSVVDSIGETTVIPQNSIVITSVNVRRKNGSTWLDNILGIVTPWNGCGDSRRDI